MIPLHQLRAVLVAALLLIPVCAMHGQAVYGSAGLAAFYVDQNSSLDHQANVGTGSVGGYFNFPIQSRLTAGVDVRTVYSPGSHGGSFTGAALRIGFVPHTVRLMPYFQLGGGVANTSAKFYTVYTSTGSQTYDSKSFTNGALELAFGLDVRLTDRFDWRVFDYGAAAGGGGSNPTAAMGFLTSGVVYHFRQR
jgi:hypothetical protein